MSVLRDRIVPRSYSEHRRLSRNKRSCVRSADSFIAMNVCGSGGRTITCILRWDAETCVVRSRAAVMDTHNLNRVERKDWRTRIATLSRTYMHQDMEKCSILIR